MPRSPALSPDVVALTCGQRAVPPRKPSPSSAQTPLTYPVLSLFQPRGPLCSFCVFYSRSLSLLSPHTWITRLHTPSHPLGSLTWPAASKLLSYDQTRRHSAAQGITYSAECRIEYGAVHANSTSVKPRPSLNRYRIFYNILLSEKRVLIFF